MTFWFPRHSTNVVLLFLNTFAFVTGLLSVFSPVSASALMSVHFFSPPELVTPPHTSCECALRDSHELGFYHCGFFELQAARNRASHFGLSFPSAYAQVFSSPQFFPPPIRFFFGCFHATRRKAFFRLDLHDHALICELSLFPRDGIACFFLCRSLVVLPPEGFILDVPIYPLKYIWVLRFCQTCFGSGTSFGIFPSAPVPALRFFG